MEDLLLIRHAEPRASDRLRLDIGGISRAKSKAKELVKDRRCNFDVMGASQILRAQDTALAMGAKRLIIYPLLNEINPGIDRYVFANMLARGNIPAEIYELLLAAGDQIRDELVPQIPSYVDGCITHASVLAAVKIALLHREKPKTPMMRPNLAVTHLGYVALKR